MFSRKIVLVLFLTVLLCVQLGCCNRQKVPGKAGSSSGTTNQTSKEMNKYPDAQSAREASLNDPHEVLAKTGLNYSLDGSRANRNKAKGSSFFETQYLEGVRLMEAGEFSKAISVFEDISERYPNSEEASVAQLCVAELYFRNKSNQLALEKYKFIVENFPNSHAAENARAGIQYLENFEKYEQEYIPSDVEDRKRRGF